MNREQLAANFVNETLQQRFEMVLESNPTVEEQDEFLRLQAAKVTEHQQKIREGFDTLFERVGFVPKGENPQRCPDIVLGHHDDRDFGKGMLVAEVIHYPQTNSAETYIKFFREDEGKNIFIHGGSLTPDNFGDDYVEFARTAIADSDGQFLQALSNLSEEKESLDNTEETLKMIFDAAADEELNPQFAKSASRPQQA